MSLTMAVVPARAGSKGIPSKNIRHVAGVSLVERAIVTCLDSDVNMVVVSTNCPDVKRLAAYFPVEIVDRPEGLCTPMAHSESAVKHAIESVGWTGDNTLLVQCTSPLTQPEDVNGVIRMLDDYDSVFTAAPFHGFVWRDGEPVNHSPYRRLMRQEINEVVENGAVYGFRTHGFMQYENRIFGRKGIYMMPEERSLEIDEPFHLILAETMIKKNTHVNSPKVRAM